MENLPDCVCRDSRSAPTTLDPAPVVGTELARDSEQNDSFSLR